MRLELRVGILGALLAAMPRGVASQAVPDGFSWEPRVAAPFDSDPVGFAFLPDGRVLVIERATGIVRLSPVGATSSVVILTIPDVEALNAPERGLLGVAVDPAWPTRPYVYFDLTHSSGNSRVVRYSGSGAVDEPSSVKLELSDPYLVLADIPDTHPNHNAGTLRFDGDGRLCVSTGDDTNSCSSQDLDDLRGKILRLDVSALPPGAGGPPPKSLLTPSDNPFDGPSDNARLVYAWGLRNPFRFAIDSKTGTTVIGEVGQIDYEEIDDLPSGGGLNFGWPQWEGKARITMFGDCGLDNEFTDPEFIVAHPKGLIAITGGPVIRGAGGALPASYDGDTFFFEFFSGTMTRLTRDGPAWAVAPPEPGQPDPSSWGTGFIGVSDAALGPDGALYLTSILSSFPGGPGVYRIALDGPNTAPEVPPGAFTARAFPNPADGRGTNLVAPRSGTTYFEIFDVRGRTIRVIAAAGDRAHWDGRAQSGVAVPAGVYYFRAHSRRTTVAQGTVTLVR